LSSVHDKQRLNEVAAFRGDFLQADFCRQGWRQQAYKDVLVALRGKKIAEGMTHTLHEGFVKTE
jgi:hypothetical protein